MGGVQVTFKVPLAARVPVDTVALTLWVNCPVILTVTVVGFTLKSCTNEPTFFICTTTFSELEPQETPGETRLLTAISMAEGGAGVHLKVLPLTGGTPAALIETVLLLAVPVKVVFQL
jgi:hypothetical protein